MNRLLPMSTLILMLLLAGPAMVSCEDGPTGAPENWAEVFFKANQAYRDGDYQAAAEGYTRLISTGQQSPRVQYNLGNAWFKLNKPGRAILAYERARVHMPRDADLNFNLSHARDQVLDAISPSKGWATMAFFWLPSFNPRELFWSFALINALFWTALLIRLFYRPEWLFYGLLLFMSLWVLSGLSLGLKWFETHHDRRAVILQKEVNVLAGPHEGDTVLFKLHEGSIVKEERAEGRWRLIRLPDKKRGWLPEKSVERIFQDFY